MTTLYSTAMKSPNIYECRDHREFLQLYLDQKSSPSLRGLARKAGFKSAGQVTMIIQGRRRLTSRSADLLSRALKLKGKRRSLLSAFARVDSARTEKEKYLARQEILKIKSHRPEFQLSAKQYSFLATWYYPVLFSLLQNFEGPLDADILASSLGRGVTSAAVDKALLDLVALGLIEKVGERKWRPLNAAVSTPEDVRDMAIAQYHRNTIALAEEALQLPMDAREFNGLTVAVPSHMVRTVKEKIRRFRTELNELLAQEKSPANVYQMNLHFFPLTNGLERKDR